MKKTFLLLALFTLLVGAPSAYACSPAPGWPPSATQNLESKDVAFVGTVTGIAQDKSVNGDYHITFAVNETYKGSLENTVTVQTRSSSAACGYDNGYTAFKTGTVWAIYADEDNGAFATNSLSLNTSYPSVADAKTSLTDLGLTPVEEEPTMCTMQYAPVCGKDANGTIKTYGNSCTLGAEKATFLYEGECKVEVETIPTTNLWIGIRGADVTWLQNYLIAKATGSAALSLATVGSTGYFGSLTKAALAEFQSTHNIAPAFGYFGGKTRAAITALMTPAATATFTGEISAVNTGCFADGICSVTVDGKEVIVMAGMRIDVPPLGSLKGVDSFGDLENEVGSKAEVYAAPTKEGDADYTLYGSTSYYVKVLD